jgi:hypothetical protein
MLRRVAPGSLPPACTGVLYQLLTLVLECLWEHIYVMLICYFPTMLCGTMSYVRHARLTLNQIKVCLVASLQQPVPIWFITRSHLQQLVQVVRFRLFGSLICSGMKSWYSKQASAATPQC